MKRDQTPLKFVEPANLVRLKEGAEKSNLSVLTLRRYIAAGKISGYRVGPKLLMVDMNELDLLLVKKIPATKSGGQ